MPVLVETIRGMEIWDPNRVQRAFAGRMDIVDAPTYNLDPTYNLRKPRS